MILKLTSFGEEMAAKAAPSDNRTHRPWTFQVMKNQENLVFIIVNLLSSPSFLTLQNKNEPRRIAQIDTIKANKIFIKDKFGLKATDKIDIDIKVKLPVKSKKCSV
jgi:hypothetical protein